MTTHVLQDIFAIPSLERVEKLLSVEYGIAESEGSEKTIVVYV